MKRRIVVCLGMLLALCLWGDAIAVLSLNRSSRQLVALAESHRIQSMREALASSAVHLQKDLLARVGGSPPTLDQSAKALARFDKSLARCGTCHHEPVIKAKLDAITATYQAYRLTAVEAPRGDEVKAAASQQSMLISILDDLVAQTTTVSDQALQHLASRTRSIASSLSVARKVLWGTALAALVAGGFIALHLERRMSRPIEALLEGIDRVRQGDLTHRFRFKADEEFHILANAFNRAYEGLKNAQEGMLQAEKMAAVGKLAAGVAHEVGNPLASISSVAQIMRRQTDSEEQREQIDLIMAHINRISKIVRELLTFSRPAGDEKRLIVRVDALLDNAAALLKYDKRARNIHVECDYGTDQGLVRGDADRLLLVFTNIMLNAFDAITHEGIAEGRLDITTRHKQDCMIISFTNNGPGMDDRQIENAFEPFFTTKEPGQGTGLGLWICYQVISAHGGTIRIDRDLDKGSRFVVELPCLAEDSPRADDPVASEEDHQPVAQH